MAKKSKKARQSRQLVLGYLERISSGVFSGFPQELTDLIGKQHGVYALYKGKRLYYIGLATNLKGRIKHHLKDKHSGKWDRFSLYLVRKADHIKELESLIMRISDPTGNVVTGRLPRAVNMESALDEGIKAAQDRERGIIFWKEKKQRGKTTSIKRKAISTSREPALSSYVTERFIIKVTLKGKIYYARIRKNGKIYYNGILYNSPSSAARAAVGRKVNGWKIWRFKNKKGEWVLLDELRKKKR